MLGEGLFVTLYDDPLFSSSVIFCMFVVVSANKQLMDVCKISSLLSNNGINSRYW